MTTTDRSDTARSVTGRPVAARSSPPHQGADPASDTAELGTHAAAAGPEGEDPSEAASASRSTALVLLLAGLAGAGAALALLLDKLALLVDPTYVPSCSIDAVLSCGSIMKAPQSEVFGFPNPIIGLATFPVVAAVGAFALSRTRLPGWCWSALQLGAVAGLGFVAWLIAQSVVVIGALCPWCMLVWTVTITVFWYVTAHNLAHGRLEAGSPGRLVARRPGTATAVSLTVLIALLVASFPAWFVALLTG